MGKIATKMPNFCLNRIRPLVRVRSPPPLQAQNQEHTTIISDEQKQDGFVSVDKKDDSGGAAEKPATASGRKIMIVVDSSVEAKNAVQWALSHTVQNQDTIVLLNVTKPSKQGDESSSNKDVNHRLPEFLTCMKNSCQLKRPEVRVEVAVVEGKEKGPAIVEAAKMEGAALLVLGQKKRSVTWRLMLMWAGNRAAAGGGVAEYCVQNASCMAIAVRRKSKKLGGYLITTKRQKDFWLLA
ncbi:hypothetical protein Salat_1949600 [Sesamum alatum]|uniref:UspA domain-containing protein n=1 Tax=Sesamum alatum TaxID=300844 RepID=A0AAE1Y577_9LAMI|nr:hypothetical protein Salat_1949600 [Sesamum alatum]